MKKIIQLVLISTIFLTSIFADPFNSKLTETERATLATGEIIIKNINYEKNICLNKGVSELGDILLADIHELNPKYLAEVIQYKPYEGNEDLPQRLETMLNNEDRDGNSTSDYFACFSVNNYYGKNYVLDLVIASIFDNAGNYSKSVLFEVKDKDHFFNDNVHDET